MSTALALPETLLAELSTLLATRAGWHFPPERWPELERRMRAAAHDLGFTDLPACINWLATSSLTAQQIEVLADHFTVGETYFFRENHALDVFTEYILPVLVQARQYSTRSLRIWSAACCTGEEPYSLAILLRSRIPNIQDWNVTILGTDINPRFLKKAQAGVYSEWSFRTTPLPLRERYFQRTPNGNFAILPEIREMVRFSQLNLIEGTYPSFVNDTNDMDVIFCRNVFIYFSPSNIATTIANFHRSLVEGGWLIVSPSETAYLPASLFEPHSFPGTIVHRKKSAFPTPELPSFSSTLIPPFLSTREPLSTSVSSSFASSEEKQEIPSLPVDKTPAALVSLAPVASSPPHETDKNSLYQEAQILYQDGHYAEVCHKLRDALVLDLSSSAPVNPEILTLLVRSYANQGEGEEATAFCRKAIERDSFNPRLHYLLASLLLAQARDDEASLSLKRTLYLDPDFAIAHFTLATLARRQLRHNEVQRHLRNTQHALRNYDPEELVPEAEGLTAKGLHELTTILLKKK